MKTIRVILADDHPVMRKGLRVLLEQSPDIIVVGEASNGLEALQLVEALNPDLLLLDVEMPGLKGIEVARRLQVTTPHLRILALSAFDDEAYIFGMLTNGASGYLIKDEVPSTIVEAVRGVANGEEGWLSRRVMAKVMHKKALKTQTGSHSVPLTVRERQVLQLLAQGNSNEQIAAMLAISKGTVKNHVTNIYAKMDMHTRAEAVAWAWQQGLAEINSDGVTL